ncbi:MAG: carbamoyltransferase [Acidobacteriota bacterium]
MKSAVLGISAYYHDSAAVLLVDGDIVAAAHEERFTRTKHDAGFPSHAVRYVLEEGGVGMLDLEALAFYDKPYLKFERLLETYHAFAPRGLPSFVHAMPVWMKEKLFMKRMLWEELAGVEAARRGQSAAELEVGELLPRGQRPPLLFPEHHLSHAASAFYPSPFERAAILTMDGVGEWATTTIGCGDDRGVHILRELHFPHSIGLLYSAFTYYCGFRVNSGEYKLMGLAPYGESGSQEVARIRELILEELIDLRDDGSLLLNMRYFDFATGLRMCADSEWQRLFGIAKREPESDISQPYMNLALAIQEVTEEIVLRLGRTTREITGIPELVMAGGVALNCVANGKLLRERIFDDIWIQPAAGDAGGALGAAYAAYHLWKGAPRLAAATVKPETAAAPGGIEPSAQPHLCGGRLPADRMKGSLLGPAYGEADIARVRRRYDAPAECIDDFDQLCERVAALLDHGNVVGWFQGRMEWGPRALGNRSILGDPRRADTQKTLNLKIKYREGFRPFAPSVLMEESPSYFELDEASPYMLLVAPVRTERRLPLPEGATGLAMLDRLYRPRSDVPAITHVDYSARIQTVHRETNERYWKLIDAFRRRTGCGLVVNTSFNVRGEPIVCTPDDAYRCFMRTEMDYLVIANWLFSKSAQPAWAASDDGPEEFTLD